MRKCIYFNESEPNVTFNSAEHIVPASIGGIRTLDYGVVSDKFNNKMSSLELEFSRNSHIVLPRQFVGPGKRGSLSPKKASKSSVHVMYKNEDDFCLGYIKNGTPYFIPQIIISNNKLNIKFDAHDGDYSVQFEKFIIALKEYNNRFLFILEKDIPNGNIVVGHYENKWYVASNMQIDQDELLNFIKKFANKELKISHGPIYDSVQMKSQQSIHFNVNNYFRVCAKIAFNYLAYCKGPNYVLHERFDSLRSWIVNGGENKFASIIPKSKSCYSFTDKIPFPKEAHKIFIFKKDNRLVSSLVFYGDNFETAIILCDNFNDKFNIEGFICDWRNKKEYSLIEYINSICNE